MATEALKSGPITNRDSSPQVKNSSYLEGGILREAVGTVEAGAGDTSSTYRMVQVPSGCRISCVQLFSDDVGASGAVNIGVYDTTANGGAVVGATLFASAVDVNAAALNGTDVTFQNLDIANIEKPLWQALGLTADPCKMYDIVIKPSTGLATGGTLSLRVRYAI